MVIFFKSINVTVNTIQTWAEEETTKVIQQDRGLKLKLAASIGLRATNTLPDHGVCAQRVTYSIQLLAVADHVGTMSVYL